MPNRFNSKMELSSMIIMIANKKYNNNSKNNNLFTATIKIMMSKTIVALTITIKMKTKTNKEYILIWQLAHASQIRPLILAIVRSRIALKAMRHVHLSCLSTRSALSECNNNTSSTGTAFANGSNRLIIQSS